MTDVANSDYGYAFLGGQNRKENSTYSNGWSPTRKLSKLLSCTAVCSNLHGNHSANDYVLYFVKVYHCWCNIRKCKRLI